MGCPVAPPAFDTPVSANPGRKTLSYRTSECAPILAHIVNTSPHDGGAQEGGIVLGPDCNHTLSVNYTAWPL